MRPTLRKSEIIRGKRLFDRIFSRGTRLRAPRVQGIVLTIPSEDDLPEGVRMAAVVPKAAGTATTRNRIKRLIRESYRLEKAVLLEPGPPPGVSLNIVFLWSPRGAGGPADGLRLSSVRGEIAGLLQQIKERFA